MQLVHHWHGSREGDFERKGLEMSDGRGDASGEIPLGFGGDWGLRIGCDEEEVVGREEVVYVDGESVIFEVLVVIALFRSVLPSIEGIK